MALETYNPPVNRHDAVHHGYHSVGITVQKGIISCTFSFQIEGNHIGLIQVLQEGVSKFLDWVGGVAAFKKDGTCELHIWGEEAGAVFQADSLLSLKTQVQAHIVKAELTASPEWTYE